MNRQEYGRVCKVYMYTSYSTWRYCMKHAILPFANWFLKDIDQKAWFVKVIKYQSWSNRRHVLFRSLSKVFFSFFSFLKLHSNLSILLAFVYNCFENSLIEYWLQIHFSSSYACYVKSLPFFFYLNIPLTVWIVIVRCQLITYLLFLT